MVYVSGSVHPREGQWVLAYSAQKANVDGSQPERNYLIHRGREFYEPNSTCAFKGVTGWEPMSWDWYETRLARLRTLLARCHHELTEQNNEYQHVTPQALLEEVHRVVTNQE